MDLHLTLTTDGAPNRAKLDEAFLRWLEARVASSGPDASEEALNYLVATALQAAGSNHRD